MKNNNDLLKNCYRKEDVDTKIIFYQTPKFLIHSDKYKELGLAEKLVYSVLRDRLEISINNKKQDFVDENGYVFLRFDQGKLGELLNINKKTVGKYMKKLEEYGLIVTIREGRGKSNRIYITDISKELEKDYTYNNNKEEKIKEDSLNEKESNKKACDNKDTDTKNNNGESLENTLKGQNVTSRKDILSSLEVTKSPHNKTNINKTNISNTIFLSTQNNEKDNKTVDNSKDERKIESKNKSNEFNNILNRCRYKDFEPQYVNSILQAIRLLYYSNKPLRINNMSIPPSQLRHDLKLLRWEHIDLAIRDYKIQAKIQEIKYPVGYLSRCIYNAIFQGELRIESDLLYNDLI